MKQQFAAFKKLPVLLFIVLLTVDVSILVMEKQAATTAGGGDGFSLRLLAIPWVWGIAVLSILQLVVWNRILRRTALSVAYPISSLFFPLTMMCSVLLFHEHVSWLAWLGGVLVTVGIGCLSGEQSKQPVPVPVAVDMLSQNRTPGRLQVLVKASATGHLRSFANISSDDVLDSRETVGSSSRS